MQLAPHVRYARDDSGGVILDIRNNRLYSLDLRGSQILSATLEELQPGETATSHAQNEALLGADTASFLASLKRKNFITDQDPLGQEPSDPSIPFSLRPRVGWLLPTMYARTPNIFKLVLAAQILSLGRLISQGKLLAVYRAVRTFPTLSTTGNHHHPQPESLCLLLNRACSWTFRDVLCLQKSAAAVLLLRSFGYCAELVIGTRRHPFMSHAWVELNDRVINEENSLKTHFIQLDRF